MTPDCSRVMDALGTPLPPDLAAHAERCAECRALVEGFDALGGLAPGAPGEAPTQAAPGLDVARRFALEELEARPTPAPWWRELLVLLGVDAAVVAVGLGVLGRGTWVGNQAAPWRVASVALLILALVGAGTYVALAPRRKPVSWVALLLGAGAVALAQLVGGSGQRTRPPLVGSLGCVASEALLTVVPLGAVLVLLCRSAYEPARAVAAGLSAGGVSLLVLHLHCADGTTQHLLWSHLAPWLALAGLLVTLRSRLPTRSHAP
ncbi:DUF1109 domain-containing protein [Myxococcus stipitatus]|uniref:DUF1109 domain-containing protein n=1 Tax=Myxococcus stipitatus TaxID=83455 RepID=UPI001F22A0D3|nr:DUF1109 domain-containing protein [Myxococcus stipitatus]MCE9673589.1 DUF1109 domain-containing protein [Myxococcus stipitatus]